MNACKKNYLIAQLNYLRAVKHYKAAEQTYIKRHKIKNPDDSTPGNMADIEDDGTFDSMVSSSEMTAANENLSEAYHIMRGMEDDLIVYGLSMAEQSEYRRLYTACFGGAKNKAVRRQIIQLAMSAG